MTPFLAANLAGGQTRFRDGTFDRFGVPGYLMRSLTPAWLDGDPDAVLPPYPPGTPASKQDPDGTPFWLAGSLSDTRFKGAPSAADLIAQHGWDVISFKATIAFKLRIAQVPGLPALHLPPTAQDGTLTYELQIGLPDGGDPPNRQTTPGEDWEAGDLRYFRGLGPLAAFDGSGDPDDNSAVLACGVGIRLGRYIHLLSGGRVFAPAEISFSATLGFLSGEEFTGADSNALGIVEDFPGGPNNAVPQNWSARSRWRFDDDYGPLPLDRRAGAATVGRSAKRSDTYANCTLAGGNALRPEQLLTGSLKVDLVWASKYKSRAV